jgi:hypothetical protein
LYHRISVSLRTVVTKGMIFVRGLTLLSGKEQACQGDIRQDFR